MRPLPHIDALKEKVIARIAAMKQLDEVERVAVAAGMGVKSDRERESALINETLRSEIRQGISDIKAGRYYTQEQVIEQIDAVIEGHNLTK